LTPNGAAIRPITTQASCSAKSGSGSGLVLLDQAGDGVGHLRTVAYPVADAFLIQTHGFGAFGGDRVVETDALNEGDRRGGSASQRPPRCRKDGFLRRRAKDE